MIAATTSWPTNGSMSWCPCCNSEKTMECYRKWIVYAMLISLVLIGCSDGSSNPVATASIEGSPTPTPTETPEPEVARTQKIVAFGDSITYGCQVGCGSQPSGYPRMLNAQLQAAGYDVYVDNAGVPGEKSSQTEIRFETAIVGADIVLIMIGTNDIVNPSGCVHP
ncbi:hypothetical protein GF339_05080, partial [candidate division KSB3 bacterium]|nr:hypothetical protein [candidate division KSB3 bacterium]MBD3323934.1 hypothetical protein [candidate division KSB3 bacterium]